MLKPFNGAFKVACSLTIILSCLNGTARAEQYYDAGLKLFQAKKYADAARYFEQSIKDAPWESNTFYYCALTYHYMGNFKKAAEKYGECVERFPGTQACNQSMAALKVVDPDYFKRKKTAEAVAAAAAAKANSPGASATQAAVPEKGTVEGQEQTRVFYRLNDRDKVVDVRVNGRPTRAILDVNGETTSFSRQQLASLGINTDKNTTEIKGEIALGGVVRKNFPITVEDTGLPARLGNSFLEAFNVDINDGAKTVDLRRKSAGSTTAGASIPFAREGKSLLVTVDINGHPTQMVFDPDASGDMHFTPQQARNAGIKVDEAELEHKSPTDMPVRGDPNWVPPDEQTPSAKIVSVRLRLGPIERPHVTAKISEQGGPKKPTFGPELIHGGGYKYDIDYKTNKIILTRK